MINLIKIHYSGYASQPYIDVYCTGKSHYVSLIDTNIPQVYMADGDENDHAPVHYSFDWKNVNCEDCLIKRKK